MSALRWVAFWICAMCGVTGCAHGSDGIRQGCANADSVIEGGYALTGALIKTDLPTVRHELQTSPDHTAALAKLQRHEAAFGKTLASIDSARSTKDAACRAPDAMDAGAKRDVAAVMAQLAAAGASIEAAIAELKGALK